MNIKKLTEKIKSTKNWELYVALFLAIAVVVTLLLTSTKVDNSTQDTTDFDAYIRNMENKISSVIANMDGCKNVKVAITYSAVEEKVYAYETENVEKGETVTETSTIVTVKGEPLVLKTLPPQISGVVVVCDGANDAAVRVKIKQVVVTLLGVSADKVQVFT